MAALAQSAHLLTDPVSAGERAASVDVLRGIAVLGVLAVNIGTFALPEATFYRPPVAGGFTGVNFAVWLVMHVLFEMKFITIFSMLFGAGLVLMDQRAGRRGESLAGRYFLRLLWLAGFGLAHMGLLWHGDILFAYALGGLILYPLRRLRPDWLIALGSCLVLGLIPMTLFQAAMVHMARDAMTAPQPPDWALDVWSQYYPTAEQVQREIAIHRGTFTALFWERMQLCLYLQVGGLVFFYPWRVFSLMLIGAGLMKLGVFTAARPPQYYLKLMLLGYGIGLPLVAWGVWRNVASDFEPVALMTFSVHLNWIGGIAVALGHVGLVLRWCQSASFAAWRDYLAAVGRMALSNYLSQSLICAWVFYGWSGLGLGQFGAWERQHLAMLVFGIWTLQILWSSWWLAHFRFGPIEWVWRSLTYLRLQPLRLRSSAAG